MKQFVVLLSATLPLVINSAALAQPAGLNYPRQGVVCDSVGRTCYDSYGPSIGITADVYGQGAANNLTANLNQANSRDFRLSTGQACSVASRTCWNDGWSATKVAPGLTQQLFGSNSANGQPIQPQKVSGTGLCSLSRSGQRIFDGTCRLKQVRKGDQNLYEVQLQNGSNYVFRQNGSQYQIRDGFGGIWPVTFIDHGNTGIFRFGDYKLVATQESANRNAAVGSAIGNLLNALFQ